MIFRMWWIFVTITIDTRVRGIPGEFRVDNGILFLILVIILLIGNESQQLITTLIVKRIKLVFYVAIQKRKVKWSQRWIHQKLWPGTIHKTNYENKQCQLQQTLVSSISSSESKRTIIHDLIEAFAITDIPLENVDSLINLISSCSVELNTIQF